MSRLRSNPYLQELAAICDERGLTYSVSYGGRHPRLEVDVAGRHIRFPFPGAISESDRRGVLNVGSAFRRTLNQASAPRP